MNKDTFQTWLLGFVSACGENPPTKEQWNTLVQILKSLHKQDTKVYPPKWTYTADFNVNTTPDGKDFEVKKELLND